MKRRLILSLLIFLLSSVLFLWLLFPYGSVLRSSLKNVQREAHLSWSSISAGPFSAHLKGVEADGAPIGDVTASYSPLTIITKRVALHSDGPVTGTAEVSPHKCTFQADVHPSLINSRIEMVKIYGKFTVKGDAAPDKQTAAATMHADKAGIKTPLGIMDFKNIDADVEIKGNNILIKKLTSDGGMGLNLHGSIIYLPKSPQMSAVDLSGTFNLLGKKKKLSLKGRMSNIRASLR